MSLSNTSTWLRTRPLKKQYPQLQQSLTTDVVIIGAGLTGITTAYLLAQAGKKVVVLEKNTVGSGMTSITTAFLTSVVDPRLQDMVRKMGTEKAKKVWQSNQTAIDEIEKIIAEQKIECSFMRVPAYVFASNEKDAEWLKKEAEVAKTLGFEHVQFVSSETLPFQNYGALKAERQAKFDPVKYLLALTQKAVDSGVQIFEETAASHIETRKIVNVKTTTGHEIRANTCITATYVPLESSSLLQLELIPMQTYVVEAELPKKVLEEAMYWDTNKPYNYFRIDAEKDHDLIILGGGDHSTGQSEKQRDYFAELESYVKESLAVKDMTTTAHWSGEILETVDNLPYIGSKDGQKNNFVATGFSGNGMTYSMVAGLILTDLVLGRKNQWADIYAPQRISGVMKLLKRSMNYPTHFLKGLFSSDGTPEELPPNSGKVMNIHGKKAAVYKDKNGKITKLSAICTHLGCVIQFNDSEKTWDCPCHGSRFATDGHVLNGPAQKPLPPFML